jgi:hypothetical protein
LHQREDQDCLHDKWIAIHTLNHDWGYLMLFSKVMEVLVQWSDGKNVLLTYCIHQFPHIFLNPQKTEQGWLPAHQISKVHAVQLQRCTCISFTEVA